MNRTVLNPRSREKNGSTLVILAVVLVIIGVLAGFGVPRFLNSVERSKAADAFAYLSAVRAAQERYLAREGSYASDIASIDIKRTAPNDFRVGALAAGDSGRLEDSWTLTLTRSEPSARYGTYTVAFTEQGYDNINSTIDSLPAINPMGADPKGGSDHGKQ